MIGFSTSGPGTYVPIGVLIIFFFILIYSLLIVSRLSKKVNITFASISIAAVFGLINGAFLLYLSLTPNDYDYFAGHFSVDTSSPNFDAWIPATVFGLTLVPMIWMSGFSVISTIIGRNILIKLAYFVTILQILLVIVLGAIVPLGGYIYLVIIILRWLHFLLFFVLVVRRRHQLTRLGRNVLIAFGILNTIALIVVIALIGLNFIVVYGYTAMSALLIQFFFSDFLSVISMALIIKFYESITKNEEYMYDN